MVTKETAATVPSMPASTTTLLRAPPSLRLSFDVPLWLNHIPTIPLPTSYTRRYAAQRVTLSLDDMFRGRHWHSVVFSNYTTDFAFLGLHMPSIFERSLKTKILILSGEDDQSHIGRDAKALGVDHRVVYQRLPPLPIPYGTHHTKAIIGFTHDLAACAETGTVTGGDGGPAGMRVAIITGNFYHDDILRKNQACFVQDFPLSLPGSQRAQPAANASPASDFGQVLLKYFTVACVGRVMKPFDGIKHVDFSRAAGHLVASVPGYHSGPSSHDWGQGRLRRAFSKNTRRDGPNAEMADATLVWQYSSQGSLTDRFISELTATMTPGVTLPPSSSAAVPEPPKKKNRTEKVSAHTEGVSVKVVIPTEEEVRHSIEGWRSGWSLPIPSRNAHPFITERLHRFSPSWLFKRRVAAGDTVNIPPLPAPVQILTASPRWSECCGRHRAMPHIKSYALIRQPASTADGSTLLPPYADWVCVTSSNLSRAAWGDWQKQGTQLMVRSYELGVVVTPELPPITRESFSLTPDEPIVPLGTVDTADPEIAQLLAELQFSHGAHPHLLGALPASDGARRGFFLPYALHDLQPQDPAQHDVAWGVDLPHRGRDVLGQTWDGLDDYTHRGPTSWSAPELSWSTPNIAVLATGGTSSLAPIDEGPNGMKHAPIEVL
jgi:tyrosyl-DNA phosphodiesterase-1